MGPGRRMGRAALPPGPSAAASAVVKMFEAKCRVNDESADAVVALATRRWLMSSTRPSRQATGPLQHGHRWTAQQQTVERLRQAAADSSLGLGLARVPLRAHSFVLSFVVHPQTVPGGPWGACRGLAKRSESESLQELEQHGQHGRRKGNSVLAVGQHGQQCAGDEQNGHQCAGVGMWAAV